MNTAFINAKVYIERGRFEQALLVKDGMIEAAGTDADIVSLAATAVPSETRIIDCRGSTIIPGLNDSHMHLLMVGAGLYQADITGVSSIDEMIDRVRGRHTLRRLEPGPVYGRQAHTHKARP